MNTKRIIQQLILTFFYISISNSCTKEETLDEIHQKINLEKGTSKINLYKTASYWSFTNTYTSCSDDVLREPPICPSSPNVGYKYFTTTINFNLPQQQINNLLTNDEIKLLIFVNGNWVCAPCKPIQLSSLINGKITLRWDVTGVLPSTNLYKECYYYKIEDTDNVCPPTIYDPPSADGTMCFYCSSD